MKYHDGIPWSVLMTVWSIFRHNQRIIWFGKASSWAKQPMFLVVAELDNSVQCRRQGLVLAVSFLGLSRLCGAVDPAHAVIEKVFVCKQITMCCVVSKEDSVHSDPLNSLQFQPLIKIHPHKPDSYCTDFMEKVVSLLSISSADSPKYSFDFHHATEWEWIAVKRGREHKSIFGLKEMD